MNKKFKVTEWVCDYAIVDNNNEIIVNHPFKSISIADKVCKLLNQDYESGLENE